MGRTGTGVGNLDQMKPWTVISVAALHLVFTAGLAGCSSPAETTPPTVAAVRTAPAETKALLETVTAYGQAEFNPSAVRTLTATFEAQVDQVHVNLGQAVGAGQPIVTLIASPATRLDLDRFAREAVVAGAEAARLQRLRADGLASDAEVATAVAAAATAREASSNLRRLTGGGRVTLTAPAAGVIDNLPASPGTLVAAGGLVASVASTRLLNARLGVEVEDAQRIQPGAAIRLTGLHEDGAAVEARAASVDRRVDPATRLAAVIVALPSGSPVLPGEALKGEIVVGEQAAAVVVPRAALYEGDQPYVFVVARNLASRRPVSVGLEQADLVQLASGVRVGERVVIEGGPSLSDGMSVREAPAAPAAKP